MTTDRHFWIGAAAFTAFGVLVGIPLGQLLAPSILPPEKHSAHVEIDDGPKVLVFYHPGMPRAEVDRLVRARFDSMKPTPADIEAAKRK